ncbi:MAG TPA: dihydroorotase [Cryomorphaceae bacterium]|nr:dihydroorotase [Cryomorphaceae bacterium]
MANYLIKGATIVNEGKCFTSDLRIEGGIIAEIAQGLDPREHEETIDAKGLHLIPGLIDDQVHFREPGLTHKAEIKTESRAAVAGGITSFMEMPNTIPNTLTQDLLEEKYQRAAEVSAANYSFFMGASNDNIDQVLRTDPKKVCGVKVFMGSSTGNMLVDDTKTLEGIFKESPTIIATHCEDEETIRKNTMEYQTKFGDDIPFKAHPLIRSAEACYKSSSKAIELATKHNARLHVLHISTEREVQLFSASKKLEEKNITAEACIHHLWFTDADYDRKQSFIKWNPAVKTALDRIGVRQGVISGHIDVIATDHAPHTLDEKKNKYLKAPAGGPLVQHSLPALLDLYHQGVFTLEMIVQKACHNVAKLFDVSNRGFIRKGYAADIVLFNLNAPWEVSRENIMYKCGWSPFEGHEFKSSVVYTFVNGEKVYANGEVDEEIRGERLRFDR